MIKNRVGSGQIKKTENELQFFCFRAQLHHFYKITNTQNRPQNSDRNDEEDFVSNQISKHKSLRI